MAKVKDCKVITEDLNIHALGDIAEFNLATEGAVANLIGYGSKSGINNAKARLNKATKLKEKFIAKRELKQEELNYSKIYIIVQKLIFCKNKVLVLLDIMQSNQDFQSKIIIYFKN